MAKPKQRLRRSTKKRISGKGSLKRKILEARNTQECLGQLGTVVEVIQEVLEDMGENMPSKNTKKLKITADAIEIAKKQVEESTKSLAPLTGQSYASKRLKLEEERNEAIKSGLFDGKSDSAARRIQMFVRKNREDLKSPRKSVRNARSSTKALKLTFSSKPRKSKSSTDLTVPGPANGKVYTPREALNILSPLGNKKRGFLQHELIRLRLVVPTTPKALRDLVRIYKDKPDCCPEWWGQRGRKAYAPASTWSENVLSQLGQSTGEVMTAKDVQGALVAAKEAQMREQ